MLAHAVEYIVYVPPRVSKFTRLCSSVSYPTLVQDAKDLDTGNILNVLYFLKKLGELTKRALLTHLKKVKVGRRKEPINPST